MNNFIKIIPAINEISFSEIRRKIDLISPFSDFAHLDIADGTFTPNTLWNNPEDLRDLDFKISLEAHLMAKNPEEKFKNWILKNVKRIIFNLETISDFDLIFFECRKTGVQIGLSIAPKTSCIELKPYLDRIDLVQVLAVLPGISGQEFIYESLDKIKELREICGNCLIEVDGGVNNENAKIIIEAGADILASSSYIFSGGESEIKNRLESLKDN